MHHQSARRSALTIVALFIVVSCGGSETDTAGATGSSETSTAEQGFSTAEQRFSTAGGAVTLTVPVGAIPADVDINIGSPESAEDLEPFAVPGTAISAEPTGLEFSEPATIVWRLPVEEISEDGLFVPWLAPVVVGDESDELLDNVVVEIDGPDLVLTAEVTHFSTFYVAAVVEVENCGFQIGLPAVSVAEVASIFDVSFRPRGDRSQCQVRNLKWGEGTGPLDRLKDDLTLVQEYLCTEEGTGSYNVSFDVTPRRVVAIDLNNLPIREGVLINALGQPVRPLLAPSPQRSTVAVTLVAFGVCTLPPMPPITVSMIAGTARPANVFEIIPSGFNHAGENEQAPIDYVVLYRPRDDGELATAWISVWDKQSGALELYQPSVEPRHGGCGNEGLESTFLSGPVAEPLVGPDGHLWCRAFFRPGEVADLFRYQGESTDAGDFLSDWHAEIEGPGSSTTIEQVNGRLLLLRGNEQIEIPVDVYNDLFGG